MKKVLFGFSFVTVVQSFIQSDNGGWPTILDRMSIDQNKYKRIHIARKHNRVHATKGVTRKSIGIESLSCSSHLLCIVVTIIKAYYYRLNSNHQICSKFNTNSIVA